MMSFALSIVRNDLRIWPSPVGGDPLQRSHRPVGNEQTECIPLDTGPLVRYLINQQVYQSGGLPRPA
jgi:hypothetical protein